MSGAVSALYERLIERDLDAVPAASREFSDYDLFLAVARFAILAYAPSLHAKHAVLAALSAHELRDHPQFRDIVIEAARYAAESRQPWSEPPILEPPSTEVNVEELLDAAADHIDAFLITAASVKLADILGEKGRYACLHVGLEEVRSAAATPPLSNPTRDLRDRLIENAIAERGSLESVNSVLLYESAKETNQFEKVCSYLSTLPSQKPMSPLPQTNQSPVYRLSRDFGHHLRAHALRDSQLQQATGYNLQHGDSMSNWSFA